MRLIYIHDLRVLGLVITRRDTNLKRVAMSPRGRRESNIKAVYSRSREA